MSDSTLGAKEPPGTAIRSPSPFCLSGGMELEKGFFDCGSFIESLGNWAMTVVTGRARLGGIPCGVVAVETRCVECVIPADPANTDSETKVRHGRGSFKVPVHS